MMWCNLGNLRRNILEIQENVLSRTGHGRTVQRRKKLCTEYGKHEYVDTREKLKKEVKNILKPIVV